MLLKEVATDVEEHAFNELVNSFFEQIAHLKGQPYQQYLDTFYAIDKEFRQGYKSNNQLEMRLALHQLEDLIAKVMFA